ncbi:MAG TPA: DUF1289 domain-containing protein [Burkholderiales bacterium]
MKSPCIKVCEMSPEHGLCTGCGRTLDEIARWGAMNDAERELILSVLEKRKSDIAEIAMPPLA